MRLRYARAPGRRHFHHHLRESPHTEAAAEGIQRSETESGDMRAPDSRKNLPQADSADDYQTRHPLGARCTVYRQRHLCQNPQQACRGIRRPVRGGDYRRSAAQQRSGAIPVPHQIPLHRWLRNDRMRPAYKPHSLALVCAVVLRTHSPLHGVENHGGAKIPRRSRARSVCAVRTA